MTIQAQAAQDPGENLPTGRRGPDVIARPVLLQRALPIAIVLFVLVYELVFEFLLADHIPNTLRFAIELLVFGGLGALVTYMTLEWMRRSGEREAEAVRTAHRQDRLLATITADSLDAIFLLDPDGIIQTWNRGAEMLFGYAPEEIVGKSFEVLVPRELRAQGEVARLNALLAEQGDIRNYITQRVTRDGRTLTVEVTRTELRDEHGNVFGSSAILRDVTEREASQREIRELNRTLEDKVAAQTLTLKQANQELQRHQAELEKANAELEQLDALKSEFVSLVSHELRAPLANISGALQLLLGEDEHLEPRQREILTLANEQVDRLARMVKDILNVSRIEAGRLPLAPEPFDLYALVENAIKQWRTCDPSHEWQGPALQNLPSVWADRDRVEEVMLNLLDNAYKYSRPGTTVTVDARPEDNELLVSVSDEGDGIPEAELDKIFSKFHRVERGDARQTYGYGLGLYISQKLIESMGGTLWAESEVGHGSTFYFTLPLAGQAEGLGISHAVMA